MAEELTEEHLRQYITLAFRVAFPQARRILVAFLELPESWVAVVDNEIYAMFVGSDDDEFSFSCQTDKSKPRITFPLPPEMQ